MIKIKDFTLASKNLGRGARAPPPVPYTPPAHARHKLISDQMLLSVIKTKLRVECVVCKDANS